MIMTLYETLQKVSSEEGIKDAYIKALGLKNVQKDLVDIRTKEIWFEAKDKPHSNYAMFTQLLHYVHAAYKAGEEIPPFLCVIDKSKAALMKTSEIKPLLDDKKIKWGKSASKFDQETLEQVSTYIGTHFVAFRIDTHEQEFIDTVTAAIKSGEIIRVQITPDNLKQVFDKWVNMIGREINGVNESDYALLFFADIMHDGKTSTHENLPAKLLHDGEKPIFVLNNQTYSLGNHEGYRQFWAIYHKPPKAEYRNYLLERRDSLIPIDERSFKGAYYTPLAVVDKAYDLLNETLGKNWQKNYIIWDMCCGVGNLEVKHSNPRNIFMSTLDQADIDVMKASKICVAAERFQYDYLNDDIDDQGNIDYLLTNKIPKTLQQAIADLKAGKEGAKKILVLINPPYAEAAHAENTSDGIKSESKIGVGKTKISHSMQGYGYASRELFVQFVVRIMQEIPNATLAMFSKLKYVNSPNFEKFRLDWNARYKGGFIVHSKAFDGLKGDFPIGFLIWDTNHHKMAIRTSIDEITFEILDKNALQIGEKTFKSLSNESLLSGWIIRVRSNNIDAIPLKNAISPTTSIKDVRGTKWANGAIGSMICKGSDMQNAQTQTALLSSGYCSAGGYFVTSENLWQAAIVFSVRRLIKPTWINDRDQFLQPTEILTDEFKNDCLIWMLFNGSNLTASANDLEWNDKKWSIVNHFIPFTEDQLGANERFESDFMVQYLADKTQSLEAQNVLDEGLKLWQKYFSQTDEYSVRDALKLNRADIGWYQMRKALEARNKVGVNINIDFSEFKKVYDLLAEKLRPQVFELGFMRV
ncbi:hypothetical protein AwWohl_11250 [Gammaproteobacteria bacterium]|nr:hypothetical protein AwWohl_11250 [Gammaproteobacteria bacterium]